MARRLFFVDGVHSGRAEITGDEAAHLTKVLRVDAGQRYELSDNQHLYLAEVELARKAQVTFRILEKYDPRPAPVVLHLAAALIKFDHFEWMLEKATELGVARITPVIAERSDKGLDHAAAKRTERWTRILRESCQQSRRAHLPELDRPVALSRIAVPDSAVCLLLDEAESTAPILTALPAERHAADQLTLLVGPEGGWTDRERAAAIEAGWRPVTLGPSILRAETAAIAGLAILSAAWQIPQKDNS
ncbi:MAG: 16S rRNA (uracil(1498)-N(3))-methyltransferase [Acidobacteria bacterium]|nr:16S rRNA (uracil(1498)-N(3))-methyltransferase [Acidobacteriota bacterium]